MQSPECTVLGGLAYVGDGRSKRRELWIDILEVFSLGFLPDLSPLHILGSLTFFFPGPGRIYW